MRGGERTCSREQAERGGPVFSVACTSSFALVGSKSPSRAGGLRSHRSRKGIKHLPALAVGRPALDGVRVPRLTSWPAIVMR